MQTATKSKKFITLCAKYGVDADLIPEVLSFEDACKVTGDNPKKLPNVTGIAKRHQKRLVADYMLSIIAEALRKNEKVNYLDGDPKYFSVFRVNADKKRPSGFGLSSYDCVGWSSYSFVGGRLCFHSVDVAEFFGKHFLKLHVDHHLYT